MRFRNTVIAFVVLLIIGGYAFVNYRFSRPVPKPKLLGIKADEIARIDLKYPGRELVIARDKPGAPWMITKPIGTRANQTAANNLANAIADCQSTRTIDEHPKHFAPFGLAKPAVTVVVTTFKGRTLPGIEVGKTTPVGFNAYIRMTDKPAVMLVSSAFPPGMQKTVDEMRDRSLMNFNIDDVTKFTLQPDDGPLIEVDHDRKTGKWEIVEPRRYPADPTQVRQVLSSLADAQVSDFVNDAPADVSQYGLEKPHLTVTVYTTRKGAAHIQSLLFGFRERGKGKDGIYVRRGERAPVYAVHSFVLTNVNKTLLDLRDKTVMTFEPSAVETIEVTSGAGSFSLRRAPHGKWDVIVGGKTSPADVPVVERFLDQLRDFTGNTIVMDPMSHPEMFGLDKPACQVTLIAKDGKPIGTIKLSRVKVKQMAAATVPAAAPEKTEYYAVSSTGTALYSTDKFMFGQLDKSADEFMSRAKPAASPSPEKK